MGRIWRWKLIGSSIGGGAPGREARRRKQLVIRDHQRNEQRRTNNGERTTEKNPGVGFSAWGHQEGDPGVWFCFWQWLAISRGWRRARCLLGATPREAAVSRGWPAG